MSTIDLAVIMPVYNEEGAIENVLTAWDNELSKLHIEYELHIYDDGSIDRTKEKIGLLRDARRRIVVHEKTNSGHGPTILQGYRENGDRAEWIFQVDSDDEMGADWFAKLWNIRHDHDFIIGKRYERKSSFYRKLVSTMARLTVATFYGACVFDVNCPYRLMRSSAFREAFFSIPADTFAPNVLIAGYAAWRNFKTVEIHIPHRSRYSGRVSLSFRKVARESLRSYVQAIRYRFRLPKRSD